MNTQRKLSVNSEDSISQARRLGRGWRYSLSGLILITAGGAAIYELMDSAGLKQTSALFIGLPLLIGLLTINLTRTSGLYGQVLRANIIGLALVAPLLGEGSICLLMAAPLFIGFSLVMAVLYNLLRRPRSLYCLALIPILLGLVERHTDIFAPDLEIVTTSVAVAGTVEDWRARVRNLTPVAENSSLFLNLGFPLPTTYTEAGPEAAGPAAAGDVIVAFEIRQQPAGFWRVHRQPTTAGVRFEVVADSTEIRNWVNILDSQVTVQEATDGNIWLTQTTRFVPLLYPLWYFVPFERYAIEQAHFLALASWQQAP